MALRVWVLVWWRNRLRIDGDIPYGTDAGGDPFGLVVTSCRFCGDEGNGDKEVYGTYRAVIRLELSRYLPSE